MDNKLKIENLKDRLLDLEDSYRWSIDDGETYELKQEIEIVKDEIEFLEQEYEDGDTIFVPILTR